MDNSQLQFYNKSERYLNSLSLHDKDYFNEFLQLVQKNVSNKQSVLDVGCGLGQSTFYLQQLGYGVTGVDGSNRFINEAKKKFPKNVFFCADIKKLPYKDTSFSAVVSYNTVEHFDKVEEAIKEVIRVVKERGVIIIQSPNLLSPKHALNGIFYEKGMTFEGKKSIVQLLYILIRDIYWLSQKKFGKSTLKYRQAVFNYKFPDNDATCYLNPLDLRNILISNNCEILSYQDISHIKSQKNYWQVMGSKLLPSYMGIIRIVARKNNAKN